MIIYHMVYSDNMSYTLLLHIVNDDIICIFQLHMHHLGMICKMLLHKMKFYMNYILFLFYHNIHVHHMDDLDYF